MTDTALAGSWLRHLSACLGEPPSVTEGPVLRRGDAGRHWHERREWPGGVTVVIDRYQQDGFWRVTAGTPRRRVTVEDVGAIEPSDEDVRSVLRLTGLPGEGDA